MRNKRNRKNAFTMVELVAVLIILGLLATVVVKSFTGQVDKARIKTTKMSLKALHDAVLQFKLDTGQYPSEEDGLLALIEEPTDVMGWTPGGYLETTEIPKDAWGRDFIFQLDPESGKPFVIMSYGADGEPEGEDNNADLLSTDAN
jgi:general secretion pathway protein G